MIDIKVLDEIKDTKLWQIEEIIKALDNINYWREDFLSYSGPAHHVINEAEKMLSENLRKMLFNVDESYIILALFLRETAYWFASEVIEMTDSIEGPINLLNAYKFYQEYCFYRTEKQEIRRYKTIEELRENLFEQYKFNRNVKDNNRNNIKILKLLTLIDEYEQVMNENERLRTDTPLPQIYDFGDVN